MLMEVLSKEEEAAFLQFNINRSVDRPLLLIIINMSQRANHVILSTLIISSTAAVLAASYLFYKRYTANKKDNIPMINVASLRVISNQLPNLHHLQLNNSCTLLYAVTDTSLYSIDLISWSESKSEIVNFSGPLQRINAEFINIITEEESDNIQVIAMDKQNNTHLLHHSNKARENSDISATMKLVGHIHTIDPANQHQYFIDFTQKIPALCSIDLDNFKLTVHFQDKSLMLGRGIAVDRHDNVLIAYSNIVRCYNPSFRCVGQLKLPFNSINSIAFRCNSKLIPADEHKSDSDFIYIGENNSNCIWEIQWKA
jgi:hypothetical protein